MKRKFLSTMLLCALTLVSCKKKEELVNKEGISSNVIEKLKSAGFATTEGLRKFEDGYIVEDDVYLTESQIMALSPEQPVTATAGRTEHYRTNTIVTGTPRTIRIYMDPTFSTYMQNACDQAIQRYNSAGISLTFVRVTSSASADISINPFYEVSQTLGISAGFPSGGNPATPIRLNTYYYNTNRTDAATTIAHEIGHAIGFRHTDYMNRLFSCSSSPIVNEGDAGVGANLIPGTPSSPSANSWMLSCSNNTNRPFTAYDIFSLWTLYNVPTTMLKQGQYLLQGQFIKSANGIYKLLMQTDGNLVLYKNETQPLWASNTSGKPYITKCIMQTDGNLVLYDNNNTPYWSSRTAGNSDAYLVLQSDANLVIYKNSIVPIWASNTAGR